MLEDNFKLQRLHFNYVINNQEITIKELLDLIYKQKLYIEQISKLIPKNIIINEDELEWVPE